MGTRFKKWLRRWWWVLAIFAAPLVPVLGVLAWTESGPWVGIYEVKILPVRFVQEKGHSSIWLEAQIENPREISLPTTKEGDWKGTPVLVQLMTEGGRVDSLNRRAEAGPILGRETKTTSLASYQIDHLNRHNHRTRFVLRLEPSIPDTRREKLLEWMDKKLGVLGTQSPDWMRNWARISAFHNPVSEAFLLEEVEGWEEAFREYEVPAGGLN